MVQPIDLGIGILSIAIGGYLIKKYHGKLKWMKAKTAQVKDILQDSKKSLQFNDELKKKKTQVIIMQLTPHYTEPPKIDTHLNSVKSQYGFYTNVWGQDFTVVNRGGNHWTKVNTHVRKSKIHKDCLMVRKQDGKSTDSQTFSRIKQLAVLGVVGYDLSKNQFYIDAQFIGSSASQIIGYFESRQSTQLIKMVLSSILVIFGGVFFVRSLKGQVQARRDQDDFVQLI